MPGNTGGLQTANVFLDTSAFIAEQYNSVAYRSLLRLKSLGAIQLKLTDITLREIEKHIGKDVDTAIKSFHAKSAKGAILRNFTAYNDLVVELAIDQSTSLGNQLRSRVTQELAGDNVETLAATEMHAGPIFQSYFASTPPFGLGDKRKEFPDAFVVACLNAWCESNHQDMHVITTDGTFRDACEASDHLYVLTSVAQFVDLILRQYDDVEIAVEYVEEHSSSITAAIKAAIEDQYVNLEDEDGEGEACVEELSDFRIDAVVASDSESMVVQCSASVTLAISVSYANPNMTAYDDGEAYVFGYIQDDLERTIDVTAEVTLRWEGRPNYVVERSVVNGSEPISVWVDEDAKTHWK